MTAGALRTKISKEGQRYVDEPLFEHPKVQPMVAVAVRQAFGSQEPRPIVVGRERVRLRWLKPDGRGGLVPRNPR